MSPSAAIPKNWKYFLHYDDNKKELFKFLAQEITCQTIEEGKEVYATCGQDVLCSTQQPELSNLTQYSQEEGDTILLSFHMWQMQWPKAKEGLPFTQ